MEFYLVRDTYLKFKKEEETTDNKDGAVYFDKFVKFELTPNRVTDYTKEACVKLNELLEAAKVAKDLSVSNNDSGVNNNNVKVAEGPSSSKRSRVVDNRNVLRLMIRKDDIKGNDLTFRVQAEIFARLKKIFSDEVKVKLTMRDFCGNCGSKSTPLLHRGFLIDLTMPQYHPHPGQRFQGVRNYGLVEATLNNVCDQNLSPLLLLATKEMEIRDSSCFVDTETFCEGTVVIPNVLRDFWIGNGSENPLEGLFSIAILFDQVPNFGNHFINKKILDSGIHHDLTIVANNGAQIKCHKAFILAHEIPAFQAMLGGDSDYQEASSGTIKMDDMGEDGVRALVAYLYYGSIKEASKNCDVAFEVLHAAEKYGILYLKQKMMNVLMKNQDESWCSVDVALQMFMLSRGMENGSDLKKGVIQIVKRKNKSLKNSEVFQNLAKNNPEAIAELVESLCD